MYIYNRIMQIRHHFVSSSHPDPPGKDLVETEHAEEWMVGCTLQLVQCSLASQAEAAKQSPRFLPEGCLQKKGITTNIVDLVGRPGVVSHAWRR